MQNANSQTKYLINYNELKMFPLTAFFSTPIITVVIIIAHLENSCTIANSAIEDEIDQIQTDENLTARDFAKVRYQETFVDKSLLIETILNEETPRLITAPRRFGKSINLSMLKRFFENQSDSDASAINRALFENLKISDHTEIVEKHFGKYPVLYLDFKLTRSLNSFDEAREFLFNVLYKALRSHSYLKKSKALRSEARKYIKTRCVNRKYFKATAEEVNLDLLCKYLRKHYKKPVIVLVDEYDSACSQVMTSIKEINAEEKVVSLFQKIMTDLLQRGKKYTKLIVVTATSSISTEHLGADNTNNYETYGFQENNKYSQFYGLTEVEVKELLRRFGRESDFDQVKTHYNGYNNNMFDIWSVINYLKSDGEIGNYWQTSGNPIDLIDIFQITKMKTKFFQLISDINSEINLYKKLNDKENRRKLIEILIKFPRDSRTLDNFFFFLSEHGYFRISPQNELVPCQNFIIRLANNHIKSHIRESIIDYYQNVYKLNVELANECASIFDEFSPSVADNESRLKKINNLLKTIFESVRFNVRNEDTVNQVVFTIVSFSSTFKLYFETNAELSNAKTLMIRNDLKIIIKSLYNNDGEAALKLALTNVDDEDQLTNTPTAGHEIFIGLGVAQTNKISLCALIDGTNIENKICLE